MSNKVDDHPSMLDGGGNKRKRSRNNKQQTDSSTSYTGISFNKRTSSGRPGSPHRYFDSSYDVLKDTASMLTSEASSQQSYGIGNQVVHQHLNGLCIITAGNVIQQQLGNASNDDNNKEDGILQIKSIKYHIQPSKDSQSARGKMRTKKKKRKKQQHNKQMNNIPTAKGGKAYGEGADEGSISKTEVANHDGYVIPQDTLCTVTLSNGKEIQLKCFVEGTVIEINNRLVVGSNSSSDDAGTTDSLTADGDVSLLMKEPLLDGYLAVIMPSRGVFPPI